MLEMLFVGSIVLVAKLYSTWALLPAPARQRLARRLLPLGTASWCPQWLGRRIRSAASGPGIAASPCDGCSSSHPRDNESR